jgi:hypothetical protein
VEYGEAGNKKFSHNGVETFMTNVPSGMASSALPSSSAPTSMASVMPPEEDRHDHAVKRGSIWIARAVSYLVYAYLLIVEVILLMGFLLLLFGANPSSSFVDWAYRNLERAMRPFRGIFAPVEIGTAGNDVEAIFDTSIVFAMIMYAIVAIAVSALIGWLSSRLTTVDRERAFNAARERHDNELQAMRDRATIIEAQNAAAHAAALERANAQYANAYGAPLSTPPGGGMPSSKPPPTPQL